MVAFGVERPVPPTLHRIPHEPRMKPLTLVTIAMRPYESSNCSKEAA